MKYLLKVLLILSVILIILKITVHILDKGHKVNYSLGNMSVKETLKVDELDGKDNYYFEIKHEKFKMNFQIYQNYNKKEKVITKIKYYNKNGYQCILPIFQKNQILTDIMCLKDNQINYYHNMNSKEIEAFAKEMKKYGYNKNNYIDSSKSKKINNTLSLNPNNIIKTHYIAMETYRGLKLLNSSNEEVKLFNNDVYKKPISIFTDKYYVVADYNSEYTFKKFYVVNIINGNVKEIRSYDELSFDSIMEGAVGDDIYIYDKDKNAQYKISIKNETVEKESNIKYYNGKWSTITKSQALAGKKFDNHQSNDIKGYDKVYKIGDETGYYYLYKKENNDYNVYRADIQNKKLKTYLFQTSDLNSIIHLNEYIYFIKGNSLYYYNGKGTYKVVTNNELEFNDDISFGVYAK